MAAQLMNSLCFWMAMFLDIRFSQLVPMNRFIGWLFFFSVIGVGCRQAAQRTALESNSANKLLPAFRLEAADGSTIQLEAYKGKKVLVNLWATWCPPCRAEMPSLAGLYANIDTSKVAFILISLDEEKQKAISYTKNSIMANRVFFPTSDLPELFEVPGIPATFIFNEKGELVKQMIGEQNFESAYFKNLLR
jgi:thiol-disulfide isomerase/thioredoxin